MLENNKIVSEYRKWKDYISTDLLMYLVMIVLIIGALIFFN